MSNLNDFVREYPDVMLVDAVSAYPDIDKMTCSMHAAVETLERFNNLYAQAILFAFRRFYKQLYQKPKTHSCTRTISWAKYAGSRQNRPKHNWGKKKRARMGWTV